VGALVVLVALYLVLRPEWLPLSVGIQSSTPESRSSQFWLAVVFVILSVVLRFALEQGETALASISPARAAQLRERRQRGAKALQDLTDHLDHSIRTVRLGSLLLLALGLVVGVLYVGGGIAEALRKAVPTLQQQDALGLAHLAVFVVVAGLMMVFGEMLPRSLGAANPERCALRRAWLLRAVRVLLGLPVALSAWLAGKLCSLYRVKLYTPIQVVTEEQLRDMLDATPEGGLEEEEKHMIHSVFDFTDTVVREVMTPRTDMDAISVDASLAEVAELVSSTGHSRIPIYEETVDRIIGTIHAKDLLKHMQAAQNVNLRDIMRPVYLIPENKKIGELLSEFRTGRTQIAIVQDEYGGTAGLATIEDIVEEIVGEIVDEYDEEEPMVVQLDDGTFIVDGRMNLDDVNDHLDSELQSEEFDSIGGYVFGLLGHQPAQGEVVEDAGWQFEVKETDGRRITKVRVKRLPVLTDEEELERAES
jgi:putative hemolysin